jgi:hypothetical protein
MAANCFVAEGAEPGRKTEAGSRGHFLGFALFDRADEDFHAVDAGVVVEGCVVHVFLLGGAGYGVGGAGQKPVGNCRPVKKPQGLLRLRRQARLLASLLVKLQQSTTDHHGGSGAALAMPERVDRRLAAGHQVSKLLLGEASPQEVGGDFLEVHGVTLSRLCL